MSLILDALNRSRGEGEAVPGLATQHYVEPAAERPRWRGSLPWVGLGVALVVIAWLLLRDGTGEPAGAVPAPSRPAAPRTQPELREQASQDTTIPASRAAAVQRGAESAVPRREAPPAPAPAAERPVPRPPPAPVVAADPEVTALYRQPRVEPAPAAPAAAPAPNAAGGAGQAPAVAAATPAPREEPVDIARLVEVAQRELRNSELEEHAAPFLVELSQHTKDQIPTIFYQRHDYAGDAARSTVTLNGKQLRVGGTAAPGVKVEEILPDSVVLSHDGRQFRLRALNSWINL